MREPFCWTRSEINGKTLRYLNDVLRNYDEEMERRGPPQTPEEVFEGTLRFASGMAGESDEKAVRMAFRAAEEWLKSRATSAGELRKAMYDFCLKIPMTPGDAGSAADKTVREWTDRQKAMKDGKKT